MTDEKKEEIIEEDELVGGDEDASAEILDDGLDIDAVEEFNEEDFDENFDDDFEEEISGEYDLADDSYGKEFNDTFGHLTKPPEEAKADAAPAKGAEAEPAKNDKKPAKKAAAKAASATKTATKPAKKPVKQPARKK